MSTAIVDSFANICTRYGFALNTKKGKTEVVACFHGEGAKAAREKLHEHTVDGAAVIITGEGRELRFVDMYRHVGRIVNKQENTEPRAEGEKAVSSNSVGGPEEAYSEKPPLAAESTGIHSKCVHPDTTAETTWGKGAATREW